MARSRIWGLVCVLALLVAACGDDDADDAATDAGDAASGEQASDDGSDGDGSDGDGMDEAAASGLPAECPTTPYDIEIRRKGEGPLETFTVVDTGADESFPRKDAGLWLTSWELDPDASLFGQLQDPPAGSTHVGVGIGYFSSGGIDPDEFEDIAAGDSVVHVSEAGNTDTPGITLQIIGDDGPTTSFSADSAATGTVRYWGDDAICIDLEYTSQQGIALSGMVSAPL